METQAPNKTAAPKTLSRKEQLTNEMAWKEALLAKYSITADLAAYDGAVTICGIATTELISQQLELRTVNEEIETIKADVQLDCLSRVDANGKPLATNDTARRALLDSELAKNPDYQAAMKRARETQERIDHYKGELEYQGKRITAAKMAIEHKTVSIRLLGL